MDQTLRQKRVLPHTSCKALSIMAANKTIGRAEAPRSSMLAMINTAEPKQAHPAYWAPFVVVGEGGAAR